MSDIYAVFNELAVAPKYRDPTKTKYDANLWLEQFSRLLHRAEQKNIAGLRTYSHPHEIELVTEYTLQDWFNDQQFSPDLRLRLQTIFQALSRLPQFPENQQGNPLIEYKYDDTSAYGLGAAHLLESIAISPATGQRIWQIDQLPLVIMEIEEESESFSSRTDVVRHMSEEQHLTAHAAWVIERLKTSVPNGKALLKKTREWYPHLVFCKEAEDQLKQLAGGTPLFRRIISRLFELEHFCQDWLDGAFVGQNIPHSSTESDSTMQRYGNLRVFMCPDGERRTFDYHLKGLPDHWRIHIWPDEQGLFRDANDMTHKILIGYIGRHLLTASG